MAAGEAEPAAGPAPPEPPGRCRPLDDAALALAASLRSDGFTPRTDADLAGEAGLSEREALARFPRSRARARPCGSGATCTSTRSRWPSSRRGLSPSAERDGSVTIAGVRDELGTSRKYAQALLEHLDRTKVTRRDGDAHVLRSRRG